MELKVCLHADAGPLLGDLEFAMKRLNDLAPQRMNCSGLCTSAQTPVMGTNFSAGAIVLHELEHCAFGLDHINRERPSLTPPHQDYTRLREETTVGVGADGVRGSADDHPLPFPGARLLHWFRLSDNDPFVVDATTIDASTYSRDYQQVPNGLWAASANNTVAQLLGYGSAQSEMLSVIPPNSNYNYLSADSSNTIRFGMAGLDSQPSAPADDYTVTLVYTSDCGQAQIEVFLEDLPEDLGNCDAKIAQITTIPTITNHYRVKPDGANPLMRIRVDSAPTVGLDSYALIHVVFIDGFESSSSSEWSSEVP